MSEIVYRHPEAVYVDRYLWLPKSFTHVNVKERFTQYPDSGYGAQQQKKEFFGQTNRHWVLPKYSIEKSYLMEYGLPVFDLTIGMKYKRVYFEDHVSSFLDDSQEAAWETYRDADCGVLCLGCGRGKTTLTCKKIAHEQNPALIVLTSISQFTLWERDLAWSIGVRAENIGRVHQNKFDWKGKPVVLASADTLISRAHKYPPEFFRYFGLVGFDECHHYSAWEYSSIPSMFWSAHFGMTATPERSDGMEDAYKWLIGPVIHRDLIQPIKPIVEFIPTWIYVDPESPDIMDRYNRFNISRLNKCLVTNPRRMRILADLVRSLRAEGRKILVLTHSLDAIEPFKLAVPESSIVTGATNEDDREDIIRASDVTIASFQVANEALNVVELDTVIFITPFKWEGLFRQGAGRALREYPNKKQPMVYILEDTQPHAAAMCRALRGVVAKEGHECRTRDVGYRIQPGGNRSAVG